LEDLSSITIVFFVSTKLTEKIVFARKGMFLISRAREREREIRVFSLRVAAMRTALLF
jgi:hypothetical protein